ncbi:Peptidase U32 [Moorella glycerini]|uniref:Peptidase U32 n=1 Tax=Neomoorella stamsii TaxID=1266720 RepID=A0A9X7J002_9FIRM|nr:MULTISPECIES: hypothetical protein [Moorella]PRR68866.1 hypothetical protein MOST_31480 [Moorella stamsii]CEP67487.1 Peptidase U32 [Moorella glycerini]
MDVIKQALERMGYAAEDAYDVPSSPYRFPDGAHYRNEVSGIENVANLEVLIEESEKRNVPVHRIICTVRGATLLTNSELRTFARLAAEKKYEIIMTPYPSRAWDTGRMYITPEGYVSGMRIRGMDNTYRVLKDIERCIEAGIRGFLVTDEGLLTILVQMRAEGVLPKDVVFKVSSFTGHASPAGARLLKQLGANTFNPLADLSLPMLASIRKAVDIPIDVYMTLVDSIGGYHRFLEAAEIARVCAPVYFKFEPGRSEGELYKSWAEPGYLNFLTREKVRQVQVTMEWIKRLNPEIICSTAGPEDLAVPKP